MMPVTSGLLAFRPVFWKYMDALCAPIHSI